MKKTIALLMAMVMVIGLAACGAKTAAPAASTSSASTANTDSAPAKADPIKLVCAHTYAATSDEQKYLLWIADEISKRTDGGLTMDCISDGQYGSEAEIEAQCVNNVIQVTLGEGSAWADVVGVPALGVFGLPYLYTSFEGLKAAGLNVVKGECQKIFDENNVGLKAFEPFSGGLRGIWTVKQPVEHPADLKGMKIRVPEIKLFVDTITAMGANPTPIAWGDLYTALNQGVIDGMEVDPDTGYTYKMNEVTKYYTETNHLGSLNIICMNKTAWDALPADYQEIFETVVAEAAAQQYDVRSGNVDNVLKAMEESGMQIIRMSPEEINVFVENMKPVWDEYANEYGVGDIIDQLAAAGAA